MTPYPYQQPSVDTLAAALRAGKSCLDASDTGVGKTVVALAAAKAAGRMVAIVCPKSVKPSWAETCERMGVQYLFIENIEALKADGQGWLDRNGKAWFWTKLPAEAVLIVDEVHRFSAPNSQNARILAAAPRPVLMLSATAMPDPTKMRAIGHQLGITSWNDWWTWCGRNGCKRGYFGGIQFKGTPADLDRLHRQIFNTGRGVRVRVADLGDKFPKNHVHTILVPADDLDALDEAYEKELQFKETQAQNALEAQIRARQIAEHNTLASVIELAELDIENGCSVAIFCQFRDSLSRITDHFRGCPSIYGGQGSEARAAAVHAFGQDQAPVIAVMAQAGGCGLDGLQDTLGNRPRVSYIFLGWSAVDFIQVLGRLPRANSRSPVHQKIVIPEGTIAETIRHKLDKKLDNISTINDGDLRV